MWPHCVALNTVKVPHYGLGGPSTISAKIVPKENYSFHTSKKPYSFYSVHCAFCSRRNVMLLMLASSIPLFSPPPTSDPATQASWNHSRGEWRRGKTYLKRIWMILSSPRGSTVQTNYTGRITMRTTIAILCLCNKIVNVAVPGHCEGA